MKNPNIKTKVVHSEKNFAWNVIGTQLGAKHKIARIPYPFSEDKNVFNRAKQEAFEHATFISHCFNNSVSSAPSEIPQGLYDKLKESMTISLESGSLRFPDFDEIKEVHDLVYEYYANLTKEK